MTTTERVQVATRATTKKVQLDQVQLLSGMIQCLAAALLDIARGAVAVAVGREREREERRDMSN